MYKYSHNIVLFPPGICITKEWAGTAGNNCKKIPGKQVNSKYIQEFYNCICILKILYFIALNSNCYDPTITIEDHDQ